MKKSIILIILMFLLSGTCFGEENMVDQYKTDLGFTINSYSEKWTGNRLVEIYEEFKKNTYGDEISYLKEINLYDGNPKGGKEEGVYNAFYNQFEFLGNKKVVLSKNNSIDLYNLENKDSVEDFAKTLSHEYGHHYTLYYLIQYEGKTFEDWKETKLYEARELKEHEKVTNDYSNGHDWSIIEISAEDYVQLYGSPTAKKVAHFKDIEERYYSGTINKATSYSYSIYNINPQENKNIPLALELPQLKRYWEEASKIPSKIKEISKPSLALVDTVDLGYDKIQYTLKWTKSTDGLNEQAAFYTLVALNAEGNEIIPIKTVQLGDPLEAVVGSIRVKEESNIMFYTDSFITSPRMLKVYALSSTGGIVSSEPLFVDFEDPQVTNLEEQKNTMLESESKKENEIIIDSKGNKYINKIFDVIFSLIAKFIN